MAPEPDKWLTVRTIFANGGHGWKQGGESIAWTQRPTKGDFLPQAEIFYIGCVKNLGFW